MFIRIQLCLQLWTYDLPQPIFGDKLPPVHDDAFWENFPPCTSTSFRREFAAGYDSYGTGPPRRRTLGCVQACAQEHSGSGAPCTARRCVRAVVFSCIRSSAPLSARHGTGPARHWAGTGPATALALGRTALPRFGADTSTAIGRSRRP